MKKTFLNTLKKPQFLEFTKLENQNKKGSRTFDLFCGEIALLFLFLIEFWITNFAFVWHFLKFNFQILVVIILALIGIFSTLFLGIFKIIPFTFKLIFHTKKINIIEHDLYLLYIGVSERPWDEELKNDLEKKQKEYDCFITDNNEKENRNQSKNKNDSFISDETRFQDALMNRYPNFK